MLPDYDYSGPTLQMIFIGADKKPIRNFKGNLSLPIGAKGSSPGSISNYDFDSCRLALVESEPNNRAILAGETYSLSTRVNGISQFLAGGIKMPSIKQGVKDYSIVVDLSGLLKGEIAPENYQGITITGDVTALGEIDPECYIVYNQGSLLSVVKINKDKTFSTRTPKLGGDLFVMDPRRQQLIAFKANIDRPEVKDFEIIKERRSIKLSIQPPFDLNQGNVSLSLSKGKAKYAWTTFYADDVASPKILNVPYGDYEFHATEAKSGRTEKISVPIKPQEKLKIKILGRSTLIEESED